MKQVTQTTAAPMSPDQAPLPASGRVRGANVPQPQGISCEGAYPGLQQLLALAPYGQQLQLARAARARARQAGERPSASRGRGMDFDEARLYQPGDDIRNIDWRVTARSQQPHTKVFREERERPVLLAADLRSDMFFGSRQCFKSVLCATLIATLGWSGLASGDRVGGVVWGDQQHREIRPRRSKRTLLHYLRQLQQFAESLQSPCPEHPIRPFSLCLEQLRRLSRPGTTLVIASDFHDFDAQCHQHLFHLARHNEVLLFQIIDPLETQLPAASGLWVTDGEHQRQLHTSDQPQARQAAQQQLQQAVARLALPFWQLRTDEPLWPLLQADLGHRVAGGRGRVQGGRPQPEHRPTGGGYAG